MASSIAPISVGMDLLGDVFAPIIPRNTPLPTTKSRTFTTLEDNQTSVTITVYEGERAHCSQNKKLGAFTLSGITLAKKGVPQIEVTFSLDTNFNLQVSARDRTVGKWSKMTIINDLGRLSKEEIDHMIQDAEKNKAIDMAFEARHANDRALDGPVQQVGAPSKPTAKPPTPSPPATKKPATPSKQGAKPSLPTGKPRK